MTVVWHQAWLMPIDCPVGWHDAGVSDETESAAERAIASTLEGLSAQIGTSSRVSLLVSPRSSPLLRFFLCWI
jgi:hypothetical protein